MKVFLSVADGAQWNVYFPDRLIQRLSARHELARLRADNPSRREWLEQLRGADAVITHWGCPKIDASALDACARLKVIAHAAGSVAGVCSDAVFERGVTVLSANEVMSRYVAEAILGHLIAGLRGCRELDARMRAGEEWPKTERPSESLFGAKLGFVGLGMVGRALLKLLAPFNPEVIVYDPYIPGDALSAYKFARRADTLEDALRDTDAVSVHASKTRDTYHMLNGRALALLKDGALLVNCARGAVIDEAALVKELTGGRIRAALDVYETEPLPALSALRRLDNAMLQPHTAGSPSRWHMTEAIIDDLERIDRGEAPRYQITYNQYKLMTQETL